MASYRAYLTPLNVPCGIAISVFGSRRPTGWDGDAKMASTMTTAAVMTANRQKRAFMIHLLSGAVCITMKAAAVGAQTERWGIAVAGGGLCLQAWPHRPL